MASEDIEGESAFSFSKFMIENANFCLHDGRSLFRFSLSRFIAENTRHFLYPMITIMRLNQIIGIYLQNVNI